MERNRALTPFGGREGTTLTELMVAVVIMSIGILALFGSFRYITRSLYISRAQTLATNLAQERIEVLKNLTYYGLLLTTATATDSRFTPSIVYDNGNYAPESITIGNINFTRYTYVTMADVTAGSIVSVGSNYPDTGLKQIVVNVVWQDNGAMKKWTLTNLLENPSVNPLDATISGNITISGGGALAGALVKVEQNNDWSATTDASGNYSFQVYHGTYTVRASSAGFYDEVSSNTIVARGGTATINLALEKVSTGTVTGNVWYNQGLVVSQVVSTTHTYTGAACASGPNDVEYLELFNPTTYQINIVTPPGGAGPWNANTATELVQINTSFAGTTYSDIVNCGGANCVYVSSYVASGGYFLLASYSKFMANGVCVTADAYFGNANCGGSYPTNCIVNHSYGAVQVKTASGNTMDRVCWQGNGGPSAAWMAAWCNGNIIPTDANCGMNTGEPPGSCTSSPYEGNQLVRFSSPTVLGRTMFAGTYGSAYNSQNNAADFIYPVSGSAATYGLQYNPFTNSSPVLPVISGIPAVGADVGATDGFSGSTQSYAAYAANAAPWSQQQLFAPFALVGVTTGSWSIDITTADNSNNVQFYGHVDNITVNQNVVTGVPNAATSPTWTVANVYSVELTSTSANGFVKGTVTDPNNIPLNGITIQAGGSTQLTNGNGQYFMSVASGTINLVANPNNLNQAYVQQQYPVVITQSAVTRQDIVLSQGARLSGYCTTGTTPLPNQVVVALSGGNQAGSGTTDPTGDFWINNITSGTYTIQPITNMGQSSNPSSVSLTVSSTGTVFVGTFTVSGAFGSISGTVTNNSALVTSGALIIVSTNSISNTPPSIAASSAPALIPYYMISSKADGTYSLPVRGSTTNVYNLSAYVPVVSNSGVVSVTTKTYSNIVVGVGANTAQNVVLP